MLHHTHSASISVTNPQDITLQLEQLDLRICVRGVRPLIAIIAPSPPRLIIQRTSTGHSHKDCQHYLCCSLCATYVRICVTLPLLGPRQIVHLTIHAWQDFDGCDTPKANAEGAHFLEAGHRWYNHDSLAAKKRDLATRFGGAGAGVLAIARITTIVLLEGQKRRDDISA